MNTFKGYYEQEWIFSVGGYLLSLCLFNKVSLDTGV